MAFVCSSSDEDALEDVHMIICLSSATPSIVGNRVDYALQEGGEYLICGDNFYINCCFKCLGRAKVVCDAPTTSESGQNDRG